MSGAAVENSRWRTGTAIGLFLATVLLFSRAIGHDFVNYDDPDYVTANAQVKGGLTAGGARWALGAGVASNWHPLTWMSHQLDASLFGANPRGHHATSVVLHGFNAVLAFFLLLRLTGWRWTSVIGAALWAWHPLRVESVAWVAERKDVLSGFFWFASLWAYVEYAGRRRAAGTAGGRGAGRFYALAWGAFGLGLMAKPMLVTLPGVLLLLDFWPLRRGVLETVGTATPGGKPEPLGWLLLEKVPFFALAVASCVVTYLVQKGGGSVSMALTFGERLANAVVAVVRYLGTFVWPFDLAVLYPHPGTWPVRQVVACVVIVLGVSAVAWWQRRRRPWLPVGWLWFVGTLVPVIGLVQVGLQSMADRYTYLPIFGLQLALLGTLHEAIATPGARRAWGVAAAVLLAAVAVRAWDQIGVWRNSFTLFDHAVAVTRNNYLAHDNRGHHLAKEGKYEEAMADYRRALAINPAYLNANNNLGHALQQLGRPAEAVPFFRAALKANPDHLEVRNNLANALSDLGQLAEAMEHYEFVLARKPRHGNALNGSGVVLAMQNQLPEAKARLEESLRIDPDNASAHNNLGNVCSMLDQRDEAIRHYRRATELNPTEAHPFVLMGTLLNGQEKYAEAADSFRRSIAVKALNPEAHAGLGFALARLGRREEAMRALQTAMQQQPDYPLAKAWLEALAATPSAK